MSEATMTSSAPRLNFFQILKEIWKEVLFMSLYFLQLIIYLDSNSYALATVGYFLLSWQFILWGYYNYKYGFREMKEAAIRIVSR